MKLTFPHKYHATYKQLPQLLGCGVFLLIAAAAFQYSKAQSALTSPELWQGKSGKALAQAIAITHSPIRADIGWDGPNGLWEILKLLDGNESTQSFNNRFSDEALLYKTIDFKPLTIELMTIVPQRWWDITSENFNHVATDMLNRIPAPMGCQELKLDYPPGQVTDAYFDNGYWKIGWGQIGATRVTVWEPPEELKGDVARTLMYTATLYSSGIPPYETVSGALWSADPAETYTPAFAAQIMAWHRADPPSDYERLRNTLFGQVQQNSNPFIIYPDLAEYFWGDKKGQPWTATNVDEPERVPLKAQYTSADRRIWLYTPHLPDARNWSIDGAPVDAQWIDLQQVPVGEHILRFETTNMQGAIKITVE